MMKRLIDVILSLLGLTLLLPLFIIIAIAIVFDSMGPIFFRQYRVGKNGIEFKMYKFRTMKINAEVQGFLTTRQDKRITATGKFLRHYKLDELPQLINVVKGDMSLVGPRPEVKKYVTLYTPTQRKVLAVRPGITDLASIRFIDESELLSTEDVERIYVTEIMPAKISLNLQYIENQTLLNDFKILIITLGKLFR
ncbi:MAG: sugar transferase [Bacteroidetes bacterium]|nr:sugar transferase [Bacteroidota bacterium]